MSSILPYYFIPFLIIQFMPGKKTFALLTAVYVGLIIFGYYDAKNVNGREWAFGVGLIYFFALFGAITGIITKAITLYMSSKGMSFKKHRLVQLLGLLLIPCCFATLMLLVQLTTK